MVTLITTYSVPADQESEFLSSWQRTADVYAATNGFIESYLHRNTGVGDATFQFISLAYWASAEACRRARKTYVPGEERLAGVQAHPAVFEAVKGARHRDRKPIHAAS